MKRLWGALGLLVAATAPGCACGAAPPIPSAPATTASAASAPSAEASATPPESAPFDPSIARPLLADPRLAAVAQAIEAADPALAAQTLERALADAGPDRARWSYLLGKLQAQARHARESSMAYEAAAAEPWELTSYALCAAAESARQAGDVERALALAGRVTDEGPVASACRLTKADALEQKGDLVGALPLWQRHVAAGAKPTRWAEIALKAARALITRDPGEALTLARRVIVEQPGGAMAAAAGEIEQAALTAMSPADRAARAVRTHEEDAARAAALLDFGKAQDAEEAATALDAALDEAERHGDLGCRVSTVLAKARARRKQRAAAADTWGQAIERCGGEAQITALWQGGQASSQAKKPAEAMARFERLEREHPQHRLADDARVKGAIAALLLGDEARFVARLERIGDDYPEGDLAPDGLFRLALHWIEKGDWSAALSPLEAATKLKTREREYWSAGRTGYFHARALLATGGDRARAIAELARVVEENPLTYYMALAHARLFELDPKAAEAAMAVTAREGDARPLPDHPSFHTDAFARAVALLREGDVELARAELAALGLGTTGSPPEVMWALAELYGASGATTLAHSIPRGRISDWLEHWPAGRWRGAWELAYPRPFLPVVTKEAKRSQIPASLAYAVMREESAFDVGVVSSAQAYGLMQLILPTARNVGKKLGMPVSEPLLKTPPVNVALGCRYLSDLRAAFPLSPALAIPAYNAGPGAPKRWLAERPYDDFDVFVERIPYEETRNYTKRVLKSYVAYLWLYEQEHLAEALRLPRKARPDGVTPPESAGAHAPNEDDEVAP